jgi:hypothetical protein
VLWAERGFRKMKGHEDLPQLRAALGWPSSPTARSARRFRSGLAATRRSCCAGGGLHSTGGGGREHTIVSRCEQNHPPLLTLQETPPK